MNKRKPQSEILALMAACLSGTASKTTESAQTIGMRAADIAQAAYNQMHYNARARHRGSHETASSEAA